MLRFLPVFLGLLTVACATNEGVFPEIVTSLSEADTVLPNPVSVIVDEANSQIVVANSNVDIFFEQGSLALLAVDATTPASPSLSAAQIIEAPNFAGQMFFDAATAAVYVPFRESLPGDESVDQISQYALVAGGISLTRTVGVSANPFGVAGDGSRLYVAVDDAVTIFDYSLGAVTSVDLTAPEDAGITDADASFVEYVAVDAVTGLAAVSNPNGRFFIVNTATGAVTAVVDGPQVTRNAVIDDSYLYILDPLLAQVWIFDLTLFTAPASIPGEIDDSVFLIDTISVGGDPNGMALDAVANRLYVGNSADNSVSVIDTLARREVARVSVDDEDLGGFSRDGDLPFALALGTFNGTTYLIVTGFSANSVVMIRTDTLTVVEVYPNTAP